MATKRGQKERAEGDGVASVERALRIVDVFRREKRSLTLAELAKAAGLHKSTLSRLLASLELFDYIEQLPDGRYRLGLAFVYLGRIAQRGVGTEEAIKSALDRLTAVTRETSAYYIAVGQERLCLFRTESPSAVRLRIDVSQTLPLNAGAAGRCLTAFANGWSTDQTDSIAISTFGERDPELSAVAAPVFGPGDRVLGAINVGGPIGRFTADRITAATPHVVDEARKLSIQLGASAECAEFLAEYSAPAS